MRPLVLVVAPNPFGDDARAPAYESDFCLWTRSGHPASLSNLVRLFNPVGSSRGPLGNRWGTARPLAGYYLESFLKTHGYDARAVFELDEAGSWAAASSALPVAVALSTTFITTATELARTVLRVRSGVGPDVPIIIGGQLVWKHHLWGPERFAGRTEIEGRPDLAPLFEPHGDPVLRDAIYVASEFGEHTLLRLLELVRRGARTAAEFSDVENLVLWTPEGWRVTGRAPEPVDLDGEFTRWDLVDEMPATMVPVRASVGCPHQCEFCDFVAVHPHLRLRSASSVVDELRLIAARGGTSISFMDDNALSSPGRARALARAISETELGLRWTAYLRADRVAEDDAVLLAKSGLMGGWCGIESGDPEILRSMRKRSNPEAARLGIDSLTGAGVSVLTFIILGFPGETRASVDTTVAFLNSLRHDGRGQVEYMVWPFYLVPGSPVDSPERRRELGLTGLFDRWRHATMDSSDVRATWAPHFFRGVDAGYYHGPANSPLWSGGRRREAVMHRKAVTTAFLENAPDEVVQDRFAALYRSVRLTPSEVPQWRTLLAPRDQQPRTPPTCSTR